ncbi:MAG TPA: hypothetical protein PKC21_06145 [Oligoflexia bacterium]|nr:hypothetical protein [Oligoflexia bacterium]HMR24916.1 hypothetical protein [Oligoflexia bacterium]
MKRSSYSCSHFQFGKVNFNFFQYVFFFVLAFGVYASVKYFPIVKTRSQLLEILGEASFQAKRQDVYVVKSAIVEAARRKLDVVIKPDDIQINKYEGYVEIILKWQPIIDWGFGQKRRLTFNLEKERAIY